MGENLMHLSYSNIRTLVQGVHQQIYKGNNDRNRYQIKDNLFVWWSNGMITQIIDLENKTTGFFEPLKMQYESNDGQLKSKGFYVDIRKNIEKNLNQIYSPELLNLYLQQGDAFKSIQKDVDIIFTYLKQKGLHS